MASAACSTALSGSPEASLHPTADPQAAARFGLRKRVIDAGRTVVEVAADITNNISAEGERNRIVPAEFDRSPGQPGGFGSLLRAIEHPAVALSGGVAPRRPGMGYGEFRVALDRLHEKPQGLVDGRSLVIVRSKAASPRR